MRRPALIPVRRVLRRFSRQEHGNVALEAVIIAPILFWAFMATVTIFDAYRQHSINQKAAYTIGDMVSREDRALTPAYLNGARQLFDSLARSAQPSSIRITSVRYDAVNNRYLRSWSERVGPVAAATEDEVEGWNVRLPIMPHDEEITVVETWARYAAPFNVGIIDHDIHNFIFTRHRSSGSNTWDPDA
ncbi:hypothetical protein [uncultured Roseobacter sp.]|uniref:TadE/TadG family type IV pilus assembly protein n=1 Tax=uncultured Roseobacter sp. TaxID=114847 RepID=UPI00260CFD6A|nr:hypothetical protein [uncultured Roseobacter sp.]